ncbi:dihydroxyhept-2-ene-1,7-dioic acid aldolase [Grosmannia clavigera kw1407]|uniref:Dihydroxyhept-2-ene-1,7-dioic acid aldolase n=1 Tax=Grosmannia clavigera (strain kw1407 / UAMH 11150) TaxID=655863 RepID=F0X8M6_GROCL|nr:dihydroxyhept-2-ene-1,7-dioic acid aldolase [Grosmannia clavigera kw1407]EFX05914.1 dihydroxyhept-2-ene-1,7-dioic acid aldolase [Grosmannia clavigera kw1407]
MAFDTPLTASLKPSATDKTSYGFWLTYPTAAVAKTILRSASTSGSGRFSWVLVDAEHGLIADRHYYDLTTAIAAEGASPIIRVPWAEEWMIKRALDAGAHGVLTPMCHTAADAERIVRYVKYPPRGSRGYGPMFAVHAFSDVAGGDHYDLDAANSIVVAVQIESRQGVDNVEEIAAVDGLDILLIGPFDLALQMGVVRGGPEHEAAIQKVLRAAKANGKTAAIFCSNGAQARQRATEGFDMVSVITDVGALGEVMVGHLGIANGTAKEIAAKHNGY